MDSHDSVVSKKEKKNHTQSKYLSDNLLNKQQCVLAMEFYPDVKNEVVGHVSCSICKAGYKIRNMSSYLQKILGTCYTFKNTHIFEYWKVYRL